MTTDTATCPVCGKSVASTGLVVGEHFRMDDRGNEVPDKVRVHPECWDTYESRRPAI